MALIDDTSHERFNPEVAGYCFGDLTESERSAFELHLLTCDTCFQEAERLMAGVGALRADVNTTANALDRSEIAGLLGISADVNEGFAGHTRLAVIAALAYGLLSGEAVLTELSYFIDRYTGLARWFVPAMTGWVAVATLGALALTVRLTRADRRDGLAGSAAWVGAVAATLVVAQFVLPHEPAIDSAFVPRTIAAANVRNWLLYGMPLALLFLLVPFHFVVTIQRELARGRHDNVLRLLMGDPLAVTPRGAIYIPPRVLAGVVVAATVYLVVANQYLLDNLSAGPHAELFSTLIYLRIAGGLGFAASSVAWYIRMLNEAKREAMAFRG